jgi:hypothetical protein
MMSAARSSGPRALYRFENREKVCGVNPDSGRVGCGEKEGRDGGVGREVRTET